MKYKLEINQNRILLYDILRVFCVLWIVCVFHLSNYALKTNLGHYIFNSSVCYNLTIVILALFMFISGLFSSRLQINTYESILSFYKKKFLRFYILYAISIITIIFADYPPDLTFFTGGVKQIVLSFLGLATIFNNAPTTLWFMDLLLFFILLTPIIKIYNGIRKYFILFIICFSFFILHKYTNYIDRRVLLYFPFYALGLISSPNIVIEIMQKYKFMIPICCIVVLFYKNNFFYLYVYICAAIFLIFYIGKCIEKYLNRDIVLWVIQIISYSSLCAYLFHRQIIKLLLLIGIEVYFIPIIIFPIFFIIQKSYDRILKEII